MKCPHTDLTCLLAADNEQRDRLFLFELRTNGDSIALSARREIGLSKLPPMGDDTGFQLSDIEAMAGPPSGEVMIFGSHSRDRGCDAKKNRRIFASVIAGAREAREGSIPPVQSGKISCKRLFGDARGPLTDAVCAAIERSELAADLASRQSAGAQQSACNADPAFNIEGAVAIPDAAGDARLWIGLRAPLVEGKAVLLRQVKDRRSFTFDAVALVDLGNAGIRELTFDGGTLWGIAGPTTDSTAPHMLWSVEAAQLTDGARLSPANKGELPTSAEGLAISGRNAVVLIDGDQPAPGNSSCAVDSAYIVRRITD